MLRHPFLCQMKDVITGNDYVYIIFEQVQGDDICFEIVTRVSQGFVYSEAVASHYIRQLLQALVYMHSCSIIHRDIRPHNVLLASKDNSAPLKLNGFGVALKLPFPNATVAAGPVGTPQFMAPEVAANLEYGTKSDMWSVGVLLYVLLCGRLPFIGSKEDIFKQIVEEKLSYQGGAWEFISSSAVDLVARLLTVNPEQRISASEALNHEWICDREYKAPRNHLHETVEQICRYNSRRKLKSKVVAAVNSEKWSSGGETSVVSDSSATDSCTRCLTGDAFPGGDTCDADGCTKKGPEKDIPPDFCGVEKVRRNLL
uniref:Protein kinase domain-containing protein n=1 Tax=Syphacia muris TaxID=451379 RepID=A0A0N5AU20_9BILA